MCGSKNSTSTTTSQPSKEALDAYKYVANVAQNAASLPYQQYTGSRVAGFTPDQQKAFSAIENAQGISTPYTNQAAQFATQGAASVNPMEWSNSELQKYMSPYTQNVIDSTMANIRQQDALAQGDLLGKAINSGASPFGGDRAGLAAAALANQQSLARNQTIAGLENAGYNNALSAFQNQQNVALGAGQNNAARALQASQQYGNLGDSAQKNALTGAAALLQSGTQQQKLAQQQLDTAYNDFQAQQQYPRDVANWLINAINGNQTNLGSTSTQSTPSGNSYSGILGALTSLASLFGGGSKRGGAIDGMADGGAPEADDRFSYIRTDDGAYVPQLKSSVFRVQPTGGAGWYNPLPYIPVQGAGQAISIPSGLLAAIQSLPKSLQMNPAKDESTDNQSQNQNDAEGYWRYVGRAAGGAAPEDDYAFDMTPLGPIDPAVVGGGNGDAQASTGQPISFFPNQSSGISGIRVSGSPNAQPEPQPQDQPQGVAGGAWPEPVAVPQRSGDSGGMLGAVLGPDFAGSPRAAMMSAGAAMMAGNSPFFLNNVGAGLQAGMKTLQEQRAANQQMELAKMQMDAHPIIDDSGPTIRIYYPSEKRWVDTGIPSSRYQEMQLKQQELQFQMDQAKRGYRPATDEERKMFGASPGVPMYIGPDGKPGSFGSPTTNINMKGEGKFSEVYGGQQAESAAAIVPAAEKAGNELQKSALLGRLLEQASTGSLAPTVANVGAWMESVGVDPSIVGIDPKTPATLQAIGGLTNQMIMGKIGPGGFPANNFSEQDRKFILTTIPQMTDLPDAIRIKLAVSDRLNKLAIERANAWDAAQDEAAKAGIPVDQAYRNFERDWRHHMEGADLFGDLAQQADGLPKTEAAPKAEGADTTPRVTNDAEYQAIPSGTEYIDPNGVKRRKP